MFFHYFLFHGDLEKTNNIETVEIDKRNIQRNITSVKVHTFYYDKCIIFILIKYLKTKIEVSIAFNLIYV